MNDRANGRRRSPAPANGAGAAGDEPMPPSRSKRSALTPLVGELYWHAASGQLVTVVDQERVPVGRQRRNGTPRSRAPTGRVLVQVANTRLEIRFFVEPSTLAVPLASQLAAPPSYAGLPTRQTNGAAAPFDVRQSVIRAAVGAKLRKAREARGWTHADLHRASGCSESQISMLEAGAGDVPVETLAKLAAALGIPFNDLTRGLG